MQLDLTTWQRLALVGVLGNLQGPVALVRKAAKLIDILELSEAEREEIGLAQQADGFIWQHDAHRWRLAISDGNLVAFLREAVQAHPGWPVRSRADVLDLFEQLGVTDDSEA